MDSISRLLSAARLQAGLDRRCLLAQSTRMEVPGPGPRRASFHVLLEGSCQLQVGSALLELSPGEVVLIAAGSSHRIITQGRIAERGITEIPGRNLLITRTEGGGTPVIDLFCGHYTYGAGAGAMLFRSLPEPLRVSFAQSSINSDMLRMLSELMRGEAERDTEGTTVVLSSLCTVLLAMMLRTTPGAGNSATIWTAVSDPRIAAVVEAVVADPGSDWSIERLSRLSMMSRATFVRHFSAEVGAPVGAFLTRVRLMAAAELLLDSGDTVAMIASIVGYQSESAFTRAFVREVGTTPARFRRAQRR